MACIACAQLFQHSMGCAFNNGSNYPIDHDLLTNYVQHEQLVLVSYKTCCMVGLSPMSIMKRNGRCFL
jgi:membrane-associated PAP2 superfamily phosphatase